MGVAPAPQSGPELSPVSKEEEQREMDRTVFLEKLKKFHENRGVCECGRDADRLVLEGGYSVQLSTPLSLSLSLSLSPSLSQALL